MAAKYAIGQRVRVELGKEPHAHPRYGSLQSYQGKRGTVVARREGEGQAEGESSGQDYVYEVRLRMHGNVILTLTEDVLIAVRR